MKEPQTQDSKCTICGGRCAWCRVVKKNAVVPTCNYGCGYRQRIFRGRDAVVQFCDHIMTPHYNNTVLIAHSANDFDNYPVINALIDHYGVVPDKILYNGSNIMYMHVAKGLDLTFRDSLNFLGMRLSKLSGYFHLNELYKGYSPHLFKGKLSTTIVILSYSKLLSFSVLTFIKWRLSTDLLANTLRNVVFFDLKKLTIVTGS